MAGFARAVAHTKRQLRDDPDHWEALRPLMRVNDDAHFTVLRQGYLQGIPEPLEEARVAALQRQLVMAGSAAEEVLPARLFVLDPGGVP